MLYRATFCSESELQMTMPIVCMPCTIRAQHDNMFKSRYGA